MVGNAVIVIEVLKTHDFEDFERRSAGILWHPRLPADRRIGGTGDTVGACQATGPVDGLFCFSVPSLTEEFKKPPALGLWIPHQVLVENKMDLVPVDLSEGNELLDRPLGDATLKGIPKDGKLTLDESEMVGNQLGLAEKIVEMVLPAHAQSRFGDCERMADKPYDANLWKPSGKVPHQEVGPYLFDEPAPCNSRSVVMIGPGVPQLAAQNPLNRLQIDRIGIIGAEVLEGTEMRHRRYTLWVQRLEDDPVVMASVDQFLNPCSPAAA